jgi:hypothetical protein
MRALNWLAMRNHAPTSTNVNTTPVARTFAQIHTAATSAHAVVDLDLTAIVAAACSKIQQMDQSLLLSVTRFFVIANDCGLID